VMRADEYDLWYETPRGQWIGQCEIELLCKQLRPRPGESLLDVGCGTGFFTRAFANRTTGKVIGVDIDTEYVECACRRDTAGSYSAVADVRALPFRNASFDMVISIAALCFIPDEVAVVREILRVARRRFAIGLLNRKSLLWPQKSRKGGSGAYRGAHWHTVGEVKSLFQGFSIKNMRVQTAVHLHSGGRAGAFFERIFPATLSTGAFILAAGELGETEALAGSPK
jgi:SAM-dependent methyltransferase